MSTAPAPPSTNRRRRILQALAAGTIGLPFALKALLGDNLARAQTGARTDERQYRWKMVTTWPPGFPILGEGCTLFADWVRTMSNGRLDIRVYGGGELVPALEAFDAVRGTETVAADGSKRFTAGAAEMGSGCSYYWAGKVPAAQFFATVPFGMNAQQHNAWIQAGGGMDLWRETYAAFNLVPFLAGNTGVQMGGWFNRRIETTADLRGLKMRIPGLGGKVLARAGGSPVLLPGGDLYSSLERGVIDATEWVGPYHDYLMGFHEIADYYYTPGWHELGTAFELFANQQQYDALPADLQLILDTAALRLNGWVLAQFEAQNAVYLARIKAETQVQVLPFPEAVLAQLKRDTAATIAELTAADPLARRVYASYRAFQERGRDWSALTERAYYEL